MKERRIEDNKMFAKTQYKCGICGNIYDTIAERIKCETACLKKQEEEEKRAAEEKKKKEQDLRLKEVDDAIEKANELMNKYIEDYGVYHYKSSCKNILDDPLFRNIYNLLP